MKHKPSLKKIAKLLLKTAVTLGAIAYVASQIDFSELGATLATADWLWLAAAFLAFNASKVLSSVRLNRYFRELQIDMGEKANLVLYYIGMFYNLFLPGGISGDGYKIYLLNKAFHTGFKPLTQATLLDRVSGLAALLFLGAALFVFSSFAGLFPFLVPVAAIGMVLVLPVTWLMTKKLFGRFLPIFRVTAWYAFGVQTLQLLSALFIVNALGMSEATVDYLTLFLVSSVVAVLPVSIGGIGLRELTFLYGFELIGGDVNTAVSFSLLFFIITVLSSLAGGFLKKPFSTEEL
jgi:uncharacterized membrane protein YbhN (UPF0104 family)